MATICLVLDELYPFTSGGIGRLAYNVLQFEKQRGVHEFHVLMPTRRAIDPVRFAQVFGDTIHLHTVELKPTLAARWRMALADLSTLTKPQGQALVESHAILQSLEGLAAHGRRFDLVEFTDYFGWAFATAKHKPQRLRDTLVSVRMHSGFGVLMSSQPSHLGPSDDFMVRLERRAVRNADVCIAHLRPVSDYMKRYYACDDDSRPRFVTALPPVVWPRPSAATTVTRRHEPNLWFLSKIQRVKNPELFVAGCVEFFSRHPTYGGRAILACHAFEQEYRTEVLAQVPSGFDDKILFREPLSQAEWKAEVGGAIVVVPSRFESLNLLAYEAVAAGAIVCLNEACLAFGDDTPFIDQYNCFKFEPQARAVADALERAAFGPINLTTAVPPPDAPYWDRLS